MPRTIGFRKKDPSRFLEHITTQRAEARQQLLNGERRVTVNATRAAESRVRGTNMVAELTRFFVNMGAVLQLAAESGEDITYRARDLYLQAAQNMTKPYGRTLASNRCADLGIYRLNHQIKSLVHAGTINCLSASDPVLTAEDRADTSAFQIIGNGPVEPPQPVLDRAEETPFELAHMQHDTEMLPQFHSPAPPTPGDEMLPQFYSRPASPTIAQPQPVRAHALALPAFAMPSPMPAAFAMPSPMPAAFAMPSPMPVPLPLLTLASPAPTLPIPLYAPPPLHPARPVALPRPTLAPPSQTTANTMRHAIGIYGALAGLDKGNRCLSTVHELSIDLTAATAEFSFM